MKKISVITINFNNLQGLKKTMSSVLNQTFTDYEYIVIDGGSTDGSREWIEQEADKLAYHISEKDEGIYFAMNKGIRKAKGEYLLFLNSGDYLLERETLRKVSTNLVGEADIVYGNMKIDEAGVLRDGLMPDEITLAQMMNDTLWHPVSFIKRSLFQKYGVYNTAYPIVADYEFFFNVIIDKKVKTRHMDLFVCVFDLSGISSQPGNIAKIKAEKDRVKQTYLSADEIDEFEKSRKKQKTNFFKRWFR